MADLEDRRARQGQIRDSAPGIYDAVWTEITSHIEEAEQKGLRVSTNGAPRKRVVLMEKHNRPDQPWELEVSLVDAKDRIRVRSDRTNFPAFFLEFDVCQDGVVCLKLNGEQISIEDAATTILDPFLFPQLQPQTE